MSANFSKGFGLGCVLALLLAGFVGLIFLGIPKAQTNKLNDGPPARAVPPPLVAPAKAAEPAPPVLDPRDRLRELNQYERQQQFSAGYRILDLSREGARIEPRYSRSAQDVFVEGLRGFSDREYKIPLRLKRIGVYTYSTIVGNVRAIPRYKLMSEAEAEEETRLRAAYQTFRCVKCGLDFEGKPPACPWCQQKLFWFEEK